jgi:hypothetical protein
MAGTQGYSEKEMHIINLGRNDGYKAKSADKKRRLSTGFNGGIWLGPTADFKKLQQIYDEGFNETFKG